MTLKDIIVETPGTDHIVPIARLEAFRGLKLSKLESFRALIFSRLESFRALNTLLVVGKLLEKKKII